MKRASPTERMLARVCREVGARVKFNANLPDMNLGFPGNDERRIEVLAQDLPCFNGAQLAIDIVLRSALDVSGEPQRGGRGSACPASATCLELLTSRRCRLVVVAIAREAPAMLAHSLAWERRWTDARNELRSRLR